jgi:Zn-finger nucleic acid-binding protein
MALDRYKLSGLKFEGCPKCHGMWLEKDELRQLKNKVNDGQLHWLNREVDNIEKASSISSSRFCPKCMTNKLRSILFGHSGVIIDWCPVCHSVWLDRDEFDSIVSYLREEATAATPREIAHEIGEDLKRTVTGEGPESRLADFGDAAFALEACANAFVFEHPAFFRFLTGEARSGRSIGMD